MASETARQRHVYRYYSPWLEKYGKPKPVTAAAAPRSTNDSKPRSSSDTALNAFAQLACLRLNVKRSIVTLIGTVQQYILAEATRTLSLVEDTEHHTNDELWFGNAVLPRSQGVSADALHPGPYSTRDEHGAEYMAHALVVNDIAADDRFSKRGFAGAGVSFYAGVPIKSKNGMSIGVYTVTDDRPRDGITAEELKFLENMANIVQDHLEGVRATVARGRGDRLVRSLSSFVEGRSTYAEHSANEPQSNEPATVPEGETQAAERAFKGMTISDASQGLRDGLFHHKTTGPGQGAEIVQTTLPPSQNSEPVGELSPNQRSDGDKSAALQFVPPTPGEEDTMRGKVPDEQRKVFRRAADLLRNAMGVDGVVFFDASSANYRRGASAADNTSDQQSHSSDSGSDASTHSATSEQVVPGLADAVESGDAAAHHRTASKSRSSSESRHRKSRACDVLGMAVKVNGMPDSKKLSPGKVHISEQNLRRCIRRYPSGKLFLYNVEGVLSSSDTEPSHPRAPQSHVASGVGVTTRSDARKRKGEQQIARAFQKIVPGTRSLVFFPLWNYSKDRWSAGVFIWSTKAEDLINVQDDLSYIQAFGFCIMNEINRLSVVDADYAKSTFLANISHELRSPLHGILGSLEFLRDTAVDAFQSDLITSVDTCGRTLLDTMDHVLDHAKINQLSRKTHGEFGFTHRLLESEHMSADHQLTDTFNLATVVEEAVNAVHAGQTYRSTNLEWTPQAGRSSMSAKARSTVKQGSKTRRERYQVAAEEAGKVELALDIESHVDWHVISQPGGFRRVITNLVGNALKYTKEGIVNVSLFVKGPYDPDSSAHLPCCITVTDTGRGMSEDFVRHHVFTPFQQEDSFFPGTGLGLSIVRQIVQSLGGTIDLRSEKGVGTEIKVHLELPRGSGASIPDKSAEELVSSVQRRCEGRVVCMLNPEDKDLHAPVEPSASFQLKSLQQSITDLTSQWFGMRVKESKNMDGVEADFFMYAEPPPIEVLLEAHGSEARQTQIPVLLVCTNPMEAASLRARGLGELIDSGRMLEIVSQPCGPITVAQAFDRCLRNLEKEQDQDDDNEDGSESEKARAPSSGEERQPQHCTDEKRPTSTRTTSTMSNFTNCTDSPERCGTPTSDDKQRSRSRGPSSRLSSAEPAQPLGGGNQKGVASPRVLVVDDNAINLQLLTTFMKKSRLPYEAASDGLQALTAFKRAFDDANQESFRYVLMDISMPVMDGLESTREIRRFERTRGVGESRKRTKSSNGSSNTRKKRESSSTEEESGQRVAPRAVVIALTGLANEATQRDAESSGIDRFISKPVRFGDLKRLLVP